MSDIDLTNPGPALDRAICELLRIEPLCGLITLMWTKFETNYCSHCKREFLTKDDFVKHYKWPEVSTDDAVAVRLVWPKLPAYYQFSRDGDAFWFSIVGLTQSDTIGPFLTLALTLCAAAVESKKGE